MRSREEIEEDMEKTTDRGLELQTMLEVLLDMRGLLLNIQENVLTKTPPTSSVVSGPYKGEDNHINLHISSIPDTDKVVGGKVNADTKWCINWENHTFDKLCSVCNGRDNFIPSRKER